MTYLNDIRVSSKVVGATGMPAGIESLLSAPVQTLRVWYERASQQFVCEVAQGLAHLADELLALLGQPDGAVEPAEQPHAQRLLQRLDLMAHRRLGDMQFFRGQGEAEKPGRRLEGAQSVHRGQARRHDDPLSHKLFLSDT